MLFVFGKFSEWFLVLLKNLLKFKVKVWLKNLKREKKSAVILWWLLVYKKCIIILFF